METYKSELELQQKVWLWFYENYPQHRLPMVGNKPRCLLVHNLLNAKSIVEAAKLQSCGLTKGFPDLTLYVPKYPFCGLVMELKLPGEKPRKEQIEVLDALSINKYYVCVCDTFFEAKKQIEDYLSLIQLDEFTSK